jgi:hypothetical protein
VRGERCGGGGFMSLVGSRTRPYSFCICCCRALIWAARAAFLLLRVARMAAARSLLATMGWAPASVVPVPASVAPSPWPTLPLTVPLLAAPPRGDCRTPHTGKPSIGSRGR